MLLHAGELGNHCSHWPRENQGHPSSMGKEMEVQRGRVACPNGAIGSGSAGKPGDTFWAVWRSLSGACWAHTAVIDYRRKDHKQPPHPHRHAHNIDTIHIVKNLV